MKKMYQLLGIPILLLLFGSSYGYGQYCAIGGTNNTYFTNSVVTTGGVTNINQVGLTAPAGNYQDFTSEVVTSFPGGSFEITTSHNSNPGVAIFIDWNNDEEFSIDERVFNTAGYVSGGIQTTIEVPETQSQGDFRMRLVTDWFSTNPSSCGTAQYQVGYDYTVTVGPPPTCFPPTDIDQEFVSISSVELSWDSPSNSAGTTIEWATADFTPGEGEEDDSDASSGESYVVEGLIAGETYYFYLQSDCGVDDGVSVWTGPIIYNAPDMGDQCETAIEVTSLPFTTTDNTANYSDFYGGSPGASGCGTTGNYLNGNDVVYTYTADYSGLLNVQMDPTATWSGIFVYEACDEIGVKCVAGIGNTNSNLREFDMDVTNGVAYYFVISTNPAPQTTEYTFSLNNCLAPSNPQVNNISPISADLTWTENGLATEWEVQYGESGFTLGDGIIDQVSGSPAYQFDDLDPEITYGYYIRSICGVDNETDWIGPFTFTTTALCANPTNVTTSLITDEGAMISWDAASTNLSWDIEWQAGMFDQGESSEPIISGVPNPFTVDGLDPATQYFFYIKASCADGAESDWVGPFNFTTLPSCLAPSDLVTFNFTATSAQVSWVENGDATSWGVIYGETGFDATEDGETVIVSDTTALIEDLDEGVEYEFYVYADCGEGDASDTVGPVVKLGGYCVPVSTSALDYISNFTTTNAINNINHSTSASPAGGYADYTEDFTLSVAPSDEVDFSSTFTDSPYGLRIWVDWNKNFQFEDEEELFFLYSNSVTKSGVLNIPDDVLTGNYTMRVRSVYSFSTITPQPCNTVQWGEARDYTLQVLGCGSAPVSGVEVASSGTSALVTWNAGVEDQWNLEYGPVGFNLGEGSLVEDLTENEYEITGLDPETEYDVYVQGFCDAVQISDWNDVTTFKTAITTLPFLETFEEASETVDLWSTESLAGTGDWTYATGSSGGLITTAFDGDLNARFVSQAGTGTPRALLISPTYDLSAETQVELSFYYGQQAWGNDQNELKVWYRTAPSEAWVELAHYTNNVSAWTAETIMLDDLSGTMQIAFEGINNFGRANVIDNVGLSLCPRPTDVIADEITATTAEISWTENGAATEWNIEYGPVGFTPGTGTTISGVDASPYLLEGLTQETTYEVRVQADCGAEESLWSEGEIFETILSCPIVTDIVITELEPTSFTVTWVPGGDETEWTVELIEQGEAPGSGTVVTVTGTPTYDFIDVDQETAYTVVINAVCDATEEVISPNATTNVTTPATCPAPSTLIVSNITASTVDLNWTNNGTSTDFIIEYGEEGFDLGTGTEVSVSGATSTTITGLVSETAYTFYVFADCGTEKSNPSTPRTRTTLPSCLAATDLVASNPTAFTIDLTWTNNNPSDDFIVEYGEAGFDLGTGETVNVSGTSITIEDLDAETTYDFYVYADCGDGDIAAVSDVASETTLEACPAPTNLTVTDETQSSVVVTWTAGGNEVEWTLEYGPAGFEPGEGEIVDGLTDPTFTIEGLDNSTEYDVYVTGNCPNDDNSTTVSTNFFTAFGCGGVFVDDGGIDGNYSNNADFTWTICPDSEDEYVRVTFNSFNTESSFDGLYVFDGDDITAPQIPSNNGPGSTIGPLTQPGAFWGTNIPGPFEASQDNESGCLTFRFLSDGSFTRPGWDADIECLNCTPTKPADTSVNICRADETVDLFDLIDIDTNEIYGNWEMPANESLLEGSIVTFGFIPSGTYEALYIVNTPCVNDTTVVELNIFPPSTAGNNGSINVCRNEPTNLFDGLLGNVDLGGTWFSPNGTELTSSLITSSNIAGSYNYDYVVSNGVCPADTQFVEVIVGQCDYLSVDDEKLGLISVYPNPASEVINIKNESAMEQLSVEILDMNGRLVYANDNLFNNGTTATISVANFDKGVYTIRVHNFEGQRIFKVVKH